MDKIKNFLKKFGMLTYGNSMLPLFFINDKVFIKERSFSKIKINDIVLFTNFGKLIGHRVVYKSNKYIITKGDNALLSDGKIFPNQILGVIYKIKRNGRFFNPNTFYLIQSTHYFNEIVKIKKSFDKEKINYVFLKGLPLHLYYEGKHPKRIYADCDVLIDKNDFEKAEKILFGFGYKKADTSLSKIQKKLIDKEVENAFWKVIDGFSVVFDLHLEVVFMMTQLGSLDALYPQKFIDKLTEEFLKTKRKVKILNENFLILNTKYLILYLVLHLFHHNFKGAFRYEFLNQVIKKTGNKEKIFQEIVEIVERYKLNNFIYPVFYLLKKYYQTPMPKSFLKQISIKNSLTRKLADKIIKKINIFDDDPRIQAGINRFLNLFFFSPNPFWKRIFVFFNPQVITAFMWSMYTKIRFSKDIISLAGKFKPKVKKDVLKSRKELEKNYVRF
ncbi:MAG: hypothetical protein KatS3mg091_654 [Patescibacteria group bacterium]|nr:MAG: hypothetical protein KatS3mg091_654 [Patescibacteria group bacterium]